MTGPTDSLAHAPVVFFRAKEAVEKQDGLVVAVVTTTRHIWGLNKVKCERNVIVH